MTATTPPALTPPPGERPAERNSGPAQRLCPAPGRHSAHGSQTRPVAGHDSTRAASGAPGRRRAAGQRARRAHPLRRPPVARRRRRRRAVDRRHPRPTRVGARPPAGHPRTGEALRQVPAARRGRGHLPRPVHHRQRVLRRRLPVDRTDDPPTMLVDEADTIFGAEGRRQRRPARPAQRRPPAQPAGHALRRRHQPRGASPRSPWPRSPASAPCPTPSRTAPSSSACAAAHPAKPSPRTGTAATGRPAQLAGDLTAWLRAHLPALGTRRTGHAGRGPRRRHLGTARRRRRPRRRATGRTAPAPPSSRSPPKPTTTTPRPPTASGCWPTAAPRSATSTPCPPPAARPAQGRPRSALGRLRPQPASPPMKLGVMLREYDIRSANIRFPEARPGQGLPARRLHRRLDRYCPAPTRPRRPARRTSGEPADRRG